MVGRTVVVVGATVCEVVQAARVSANVTNTRTRSLTLLMFPRSREGDGSRIVSRQSHRAIHRVPNLVNWRDLQHGRR